MQDQPLIITPHVLKQLLALRLESKFLAQALYPGAPNEEIRLRAEGAVNAMLDQLQKRVERSPTKAYVLSELQRMLKAFEDEDSEEREQACEYCEKVMTLLGIESYEGLLNTWLYGFDPEQEP
jgi:hypothetical protein